MSTAKNEQFFFLIRKATRCTKYNKKTHYWWRGSYRPDMYFKWYKRLYEALLKKREQKTMAEIKDFLNALDVPNLSKDQVKLCEKDLTKKDLYKPLRSMQNDKSPGKDGLTK